MLHSFQDEIVTDFKNLVSLKRQREMTKEEKKRRLSSTTFLLKLRRR